MGTWRHLISNVEAAVESVHALIFALVSFRRIAHPTREPLGTEYLVGGLAHFGPCEHKVVELSEIYVRQS